VTAERSALPAAPSTEIVEHGWWDLAMGPAASLFVLYGQTGRTAEWRRLVADLQPGLADPANGGPLPGREQQWALLNDNRVRIARQARDWAAAQKLQRASVAWQQQQVAAVLRAPVQTIGDILPGELNERQRHAVRNLAVAIQQGGNIAGAPGKPDRIDVRLKAARLPLLKQRPHPHDAAIRAMTSRPPGSRHPAQLVPVGRRQDPSAAAAA
jgi:hypothetical protein